MISLVGLPGSGKTTLGRQLARRLGRPFVDADQVLEAELGCSIRDYFEMQGEARFREREAAVLDRLTQTPVGVLSTGGGAVLRLENRQRLRQRSYVIYLHAQPDELFRRLERDTQRPLLQVADPKQRLRNLYALRDPLYREVAHFTVHTGARPSAAAILNTIVQQVERVGESPAS